MIACSKAFDPDIRTGSHPQMIEGAPEFMVSAIAYLDGQDRPVIDVDLDIIYGSLIYRERDGVFEAGVTIVTDVLLVVDDSNDDYRRVEQIRETVEVSKRNASITDSGESFSYNERIHVEPGKYMVVVQVTDNTSDKTVRRRMNVTVIDPESPLPNLTHIKVSGTDKRDRSHELPLTTYTIPGSVDTVVFEYQVTRPENTPPLAVRMRLIKIDSDTLPPRPMSGVTPTTGSLAYRGINYNRTETLDSQERILEQETGTITIEYRTERPPRGAYRFEVLVVDRAGEGDQLLYKARDFSSMSNNFPNLVTARELAKPLVYLMRRSEYRDIMAIEDRDSLKHEIDRFWLSNIGDKEQASRVLRKYYERVEEANKQFSNFKEGWMTDMGMVYVLFGPPWYVERSLDTMVWIYGYNRADPRRVFYFRRTRVASDSRPFEHYILQRHSEYHSVEYEQIQRWLSGTILTRPI
jgi:GWxTD domain-containing protein